MEDGKSLHYAIQYPLTNKEVAMPKRTKSTKEVATFTHNGLFSRKIAAIKNAGKSGSIYRERDEKLPDNVGRTYPPRSHNA